MVTRRDCFVRAHRNSVVLEVLEDRLVPSVIAVDDQVTTEVNAPVLVDVLANDSNPEGGALSLDSVGNPMHGTAVIMGSEIEYSPEADFIGTDRFIYVAQDEDSNVGTATVTVTVTGSNNPPLVQDDAFTIDSAAPPAFDVLANDSDLDGDALIITEVSTPSSGLALISGNGTTISYIPEPGFVGNATFNYTVSDGNDGLSTATVLVTIPQSVGNSAPVANDDTFEVASGSTLTIDAPGLLANDTDPQGDPLMVANPTSINLLAGAGNLTINADGSFTYVAPEGFNGPALFEYSASDGLLESDPATVTINITDAPLDRPANQSSIGIFAVGSGSGSQQVNVYNPDGSLVFSFNPFTASEAPGGVRVAMMDVTGDNVPDLVAGAGPGAQPLVRVIDGLSQEMVTTFNAFPQDSSFTGGVHVAAGDLNNDGVGDIIVSPDQGGGPITAIYSGGDFTELRRFFGIEDPSFRGGARSTLGDINADGVLDVIVAAGFRGGPRVAIYDGSQVLANNGQPAKIVPDFFVFEQSLRDGSFVSSGDINGDGVDDLITGGGPGGGPRVRIFSGAVLQTGNFDRFDPNEAQLANFFAADIDMRSGIRVASKDLDGDLQKDLITAEGIGQPPNVELTTGVELLANPNNPTPFLAITPFASDFLGGVFLG